MFNRTHDHRSNALAVAFFDAIYNAKDLQKAMSYSSPNFKKEIEKYKSANNVARRLFRMSFESVKMTTSASKSQIIDDFKAQVTMTVLFTGQRNGSTHKDYKRIRLIKENDVWLVDKLIKK